MSAESSPHDAVFRRMLSKPANAASQLRALLPAELSEKLDLGRLALHPGSFVDPTLRWRHTDLLFTAPLAGHDAYIYLLIEHQSSSDKLMPLRMLRYIMRIWDKHLDANPKADRLPAVIPLVVHHNRRAWHAPRDLSDLIDLDPDTAKAASEYLPQLRFLLDDLTVVDEAALRARPVTAPLRLTLLLLKIAPGNPGLAEDLRRWSDQLAEVLRRPGGWDDFVCLLSYIQRVGELPADELHDLVAELGPTAEEAFMTIAEQLEARGEARGRAEALAEFLAARFGPLPQHVRDRLDAATLDQLKTWTGRIATADTLAQALD
ncbi:Rpn family recombination-promoting nuclease/putative transposase [Natronosporangium hydrolyticum]|uniref:Rpn family recombination-promoting nuclease/putative transposase n=1 Tax=Natronosporangium hydrolyticum TaxID=2811111 RepID=A0A895YEZ4_9ACTN|nr:Rpn family recombination-promoting nuclease/putative transposase [Natronosporangium hydrolyticum]QSB16151.1 Rpn family recombination-promoting nuclease/putative transposase [Natronosporangium hydrolyticum]